MTDLHKVAEQMIGALDAELADNGRLGLVRDYLKGKQRLPYMPKGAKREFRHMAERSITNWLPLVSDTYADSLHVVGYRAPRQGDNAKAWDYWQANGLDARQSIAIRGALEHGTSYVLVLPSVGSAPVIKPLAALRSYALFADDDDEYPEVFLYRRGKSILGDGELYDLYDDTNVYTVTKPSGGGDLRVGPGAPHNMPVCPVVRFRDRLDREAVGIIAPLLTLQDRVNEVVFALMIAIQYASFRQRWATGLAIPEVEIEDPETGEVVGTEPAEPFEAAVNRLWISDSPDTKFGDFAQTEVSGHLQTYDSTVRTLAGLAQISPNILTGDLVNLSADALAQMEASTQRRVSAYEIIFGEAWEQVFQLAAIAAGEQLDESAQVRWRDTEARSFESVAKALSILATDLQVPAVELWEKIPTATEQDIIRWKEAASKPDSVTLLTEALTRNAESTVPAAPASFAEVPAPTPAA